MDFFEFELVADRAEDRLWRVFLAGDETEFRFGPLVQEAPRIVGPGLRYRLTLKAQRLDRGPAYLRPDGYQRLAGNLMSFRDGQRGVGARSTVSFEIRTP